MNDPTTDHGASHRRHPLPPPGHVTPADTLRWIAAGWKTFIASPGIWLLMTLALIAILFLLALSAFIPTYGPILAPLGLQLVFPMLMAGMISGAHALKQGEPLRFGHLFEGLRLHPGNLLIVGFFCVVGGLLAALIAVLVGSSAIVTGARLGTLADIDAGTGIALLSIALWPVFASLLLMALWFAPTLVMLQSVSPFEAMRLSLRACLSNLPSFAVLGFILYLMAWFAALPWGLGFLILVPVLAGALYAAWRDTFAPHAPQPTPALPGPTAPPAE